MSYLLKELQTFSCLVGFVEEMFSRVREKVKLQSANLVRFECNEIAIDVMATIVWQALT